jgi:hypothetical protein
MKVALMLTVALRLPISRKKGTEKGKAEKGNVTLYRRMGMIDKKVKKRAPLFPSSSENGLRPLFLEGLNRLPEWRIEADIAQDLHIPIPRCYSWLTIELSRRRTRSAGVIC